MGAIGRLTALKVDKANRPGMYADGGGLYLRVTEDGTKNWVYQSSTASIRPRRRPAVSGWAKVRGYREGENPARWRGHLDKLLPPHSKVRRVVHHAALPYAELPSFLVQLREQEGIAAWALEFTILTAARTGETIFAGWSEIDLLDKTWTVPAERMKAGKVHRVPLSARALAILQEMEALRPPGDADGYVFPGGKAGKSLSNMAFLMLLRRMGRDDLTAHGFRSTFRDWAAERTNFPSEVAEMALAHTVSDKTEAAYNCLLAARPRRTCAGPGDVSPCRRRRAGATRIRAHPPSPTADAPRAATEGLLTVRQPVMFSRNQFVRGSS